MDLLVRFVGVIMVCVITITVDVEGAAYGEDCSSNACADANNKCDTGNTNKCICNTGFFRTSAAECAAKIALNSACTDGQPAGQCKDTLAECRDESGFKCLCKTNNFEKKKDGTCAAQIAALDGPCDASDPASDQCAVEDAECRTNGTAKCQCKVTHYVNVAACTIRKSPKVSCASDECVTHASCDSGTSKCVCDAGYDASPTISPTMCSGVVKVISQSYMFMIPILVSMMLPLR